MSLLQLKIETSLTSLYLVASAEGLRGVFWQAQPIQECAGVGQERAHAILTLAEQQLTEYLAGKRQDFQLPLEQRGSAFQLRVWSNLLRIPYGHTQTYAHVAAGLGGAGASRAVGNANAKNPLCIIVPCHRVIASDGSLGGYSGGLHIKQRLLELEARSLSLLGCA